MVIIIGVVSVGGVIAIALIIIVFIFVIDVLVAIAIVIMDCQWNGFVLRCINEETTSK